MEIINLPIAEAAHLLRSRHISSRELTEAHLARIKQFEPTINAFVNTDFEGAMAAAEAADQRLAAGDAAPLTGIPLAHKDLFCTTRLPTTCGSRMLRDFVAPYDAAVTERLLAAGAVIVGKTNMDEFAMGSSTETSAFGPTRNPWDIRRIPGGSSGGSAAAVAAGMAMAATGTDTGGSIRQPAALCGLTGIKPTYGRVSRYGMVAFASSLDQAGPIAWDARDAAILLQAMAGHDPRDATSLDVPVPPYPDLLTGDIRGLRIGLPKEYFPDSLDPQVAAAVESAARMLESQGAKLVPVSLPRTEYAIPTYYILAPAEASSNLARYDGVKFGHRCADPRDLRDLYFRSRAEGFGAEVKRRIMLGTYALSSGYYDAYYRKAQKARRLIADDFKAAFEQVDLLLTPTTPSPAFLLGEKVNDPVQMYLSDIFTINVNLAGLPALSLPCGMVGPLSIGMQLIGRVLDEATLLNVAHAYQLTTDWHRRRPLLVTQED
ncbi:MAG: Asp-tRNA(Asn)/Glu-tRNA(Gln) amidotransferase subunit GatA [Magnetococcus sp. WYHC-3]